MCHKFQMVLELEIRKGSTAQDSSIYIMDNFDDLVYLDFDFAVHFFDFTFDFAVDNLEYRIIFFRQSEVLAQEGLQILRRHPAGEIFLAPPPVVLDDDESQDERMWDVGSSHCNPYCVDSWPFEPNVLAAKASVQPNLNQWDEGQEDDDDYDIDEEDVSLDPEPHLSKAPIGRIDLPPLTVPVRDASARSL
eukprot:g2948.t1